MTSILTATAVAATTALIMGGTGNPLSTEKDTLPFVQKYLGMAVDNYIAPSGIATPPTGESYNPVAVITPEEWAPQHGTLSLDQSIAIGKTNLDNCIRATDCEYNTDVGSAAPAAGDNFVVFGYSQSATIGTLEKRALAAQYPNGGGPDVSFAFIGNGNRPNGGFLARGPEGFTMPLGLIFGGATFSGPSPTDTQYQTVDIAEQYDAWADVPLNPLNLFAVANWYSSYVHYNYSNASLSDPGIIDQGQYGDTHYYMIPQKILPLLSPVTKLPVIGNPLADALNEPLRVLVEAAYNRSISPGQPVQFNPLYMPNPIKLAADFLAAIPAGLDNAFEDTIGIRPFGTVRPGPYGVGGPAVTETDPPAAVAETESTATTEDSVAVQSTASHSKTASQSSLAADSSKGDADAAKTSDDSKTSSQAATEEQPTADDSDPVASPKEVKDKKSLPANVSRDEEGAPTRQPRHARPDTTATNSKPTEKKISIVSPETAAASTSTSANADSTSKDSEPAHAR